GVTLQIPQSNPGASADAAGDPPQQVLAQGSLLPRQGGCKNGSPPAAKVGTTTRGSGVRTQQPEPSRETHSVASLRDSYRLQQASKNSFRLRSPTEGEGTAAARKQG